VAPPEIKAPAGARDLNPLVQFFRLIRAKSKYQPDSHREAMFQLFNNVSTTVGPARFERALTV
jgi:hypothetical protein